MVSKYSVGEFFRKMDEYDKKHPIKTKITKIYYKIINFFEMIGSIPRRLKWFIQRGRRGWADCDTWSLAWYLSKIISESVKYLKTNMHGLPTWNNKLSEEEALNKWNNILDEIIKLFQDNLKIMDSDLVYPKNKKNRDMINKYPKLYENQQVMTEEEVKRFKKGWKLFQDYFFDLWD